jgi:signal peptidase I
VTVGEPEHSSVPENPVPEGGGAEAGQAPGTVAQAHKPRLSFWQELPILVAVAVGLAVLIKSFLFQAFFIPSGSMEQTLHGCQGCQGDRVMVNKVVYHLRGIHRGDIVVFNGKDNYPNEAPVDTVPGNVVSRVFHDVADFVGLTPKGTDYIKRVIALPGETVQCCDAQGRVEVNGVGLNEPYIYVDPGMTDTNKAFGPVTVPPGDLWVMGDHRNMSQDSRFVKAVPEKDVIGRAFVVIWPPSRWKFLSPRSYGGIPSKAAGASPMLLSGALVLAGAGLRRRRRESARRSG